jgi:hypothetical protein
MSTIDRIIVACCDDGRVLAHGAALVEGVRAEGLRHLADERERFCDELSLAGRTLHRTPRVHGSWAGAIRSAFSTRAASRPARTRAT